MKKFAKLVAVFAALVLALSFFVACSNGDDDSSSDSASVQSLQGLWIDEDAVKNDIAGCYILNNTMYYVCSEGEKYYYDEDGDKFSVSGNKIIFHYEEDGDDEISYFEIKGNTLTMTYEYADKDTGEKIKEVSKYNKNNTVPIKLSSEEFKNKFFKDEE